MKFKNTKKVVYSNQNINYRSKIKFSLGSNMFGVNSKFVRSYENICGKKNVTIWCGSSSISKSDDHY